MRVGLRADIRRDLGDDWRSALEKVREALAVLEEAP